MAAPEDSPQTAVLGLMNAELAERQRVNRLLHDLQEARKVLNTTDLWLEDMLHHFCAELTFAGNRLLMPNENWADLPLLAFSARSSVELSIIVRNCLSSVERARRFWEDKVKDGFDMHKALSNFTKLVPGIEVDMAPSLDSLETTLHAVASNAGLTDIDSGYTRIEKAADEIGLRDEFLVLNKIFSKFAHPTAMVILSYPEDGHKGLAELTLFFRLVAWAYQLFAWIALGATVERALKDCAR